MVRLTDSGLRTFLNHIQSNFSKVPAKLETKVIQLLCPRCLSIVFVKNHIKIPHVWPLKMWNMMFQTMDLDDFGAPPRSKIALIFGHLAKSSSLPSETSSAAMAFWFFLGPQKSLKKWSDVSYCEVFLLYLVSEKISSTFAESLNFMRGTSARSPKPVRFFSGASSK